MNGIVLDTNVVSEVQRTGTSGSIAPWLTRQSQRELLTTAITIGEISRGVALLPPGRRRAELDRWLHELVERHFLGRVLSFDIDAGVAFGPLVARTRAIGCPPSVGDAQIAVIAASRGLPVATRGHGRFRLARRERREPLGLVRRSLGSANHDRKPPTA